MTEPKSGEPAATLPATARRRGPGWLGGLGVGAALGSALVTFLVLGGMTPILPTHDVVVWVLAINVLLVLVLIGIVAWEGWTLFRARLAGAAASGLHVRVVALFSLVAAAPAVLVAVVATVTLERGLDPWFTGSLRSLMSNTVQIANAFRDGQCQALARETQLIAADLNRAKVLFDADRKLFRDFMSSRAAFLGFPVALLIETDGSVIERVDLKPIPDLPLPSAADLNDASETDAVCLFPRSGNLFRSLLRLPAHNGRVLFLARPVDPRASEFPLIAEAGAAYYAGLEQKKLGIQVAFASMFALIALIVLLSAIWFGLTFANRLVAPIRRLIHATDQVATGNFYVQVPVRRSEGDLAHLGETFNKMTSELRRQHDGLTAASDLIDRRRRFIEAVLSGVSAGVIGVDGNGCITIVNPSAEALLRSNRDEFIGLPIAVVFPEIGEMVGEARGGRQRLMQQQMPISWKGRERILNVRVTSESSRAEDKGLIVTLDDITDLVTAQRTSAWADVARRIAHEIKNPLTPIQLAAERIRRKYGKVITTDREVFDQCTDTIVRQVDDIKRMVDEFSSFARMPKPVMTREGVNEMVRQVAITMRIAHPEIAIVSDIAAEPIFAALDPRLLSQALGNIIKNAAEAIAALPEAEREPAEIRVRLVRDGTDVVIDVIDNGKGFPVEGRARLLEPYVTTRDGGTGLGLPIVAKILEDHHGTLELLDNPERRGGMVRFRFPATPERSPATTNDAEPNDTERHRATA